MDPPNVDLPARGMDNGGVRAMSYAELKLFYVL